MPLPRPRSEDDLGSVFKVQLWRDNSAPEDHSGWYVCEAAVVDLKSGCRTLFPCYAWFSALYEDARVERELTLETPTTFWQDFEHLLPQHASEYVLWTCFLMTPKHARQNRLQRLTVFCLVSLSIASLCRLLMLQINRFHTMMTPDLHIQCLFYGFLVASAVLPLQWVIEVLFICCNKVASDDASRRLIARLNKENAHLRMRSRKKEDLHDPDCPTWRRLEAFAHSVEVGERDVALCHPAFRGAASLRRRTALKSGSSNVPHETPIPEESPSAVPAVWSYHPYNLIKHFLLKKMPLVDSVVCRCLFYVKEYCALTFCLLCACFWAVIEISLGVSMPKDYSILWMQLTVFALVVSFVILQPLSIICYTLLEVVIRRHKLGKTTSPSYRSTPLELAVALWKQNQLAGSENQADSDERDADKMLRKRQRDRELRTARPPREEVLVGVRERECRTRAITSFISDSLRNLFIFVILSVVVSSYSVSLKYDMNKVMYNSIANGSCYEYKRENTSGFKKIVTIEDWWDWAFSDFLDLTYNKDKNYTTSLLFCDTNSIIIGSPRLRIYSVGPSDCEVHGILSDKYNKDLIVNRSCYPNYHNNSYVFSFSSEDTDREYLWDAHFLSQVRGLYSTYGYVDNKEILPLSRVGAVLLLMSLELIMMVEPNKTTRACLVEFTLYHPQTNLYSSVDLLAEFPSISGSKMKVAVFSSYISRYNNFGDYLVLLCECLLLVSIFFRFCKSCVYIYSCHFRIWTDIWEILDILFMLAGWLYMLCLMLRPMMMEAVLWQFKETYFERYVNLKGLMAMDQTLCGIAGLMIMVHMIRCLHCLRIFPRIRFLGFVLRTALKDIFVISVNILLLFLCCVFLGWLLYAEVSSRFYTFFETFLTLINCIALHNLFFEELCESLSGWPLILAYFYFLVIFLFLFLTTKAFYKGIFIYTYKHCREKPCLEITFKDIKAYFQSVCSRVHGGLSGQGPNSEPGEPGTVVPLEVRLMELERQLSELAGELDDLILQYSQRGGTSKLHEMEPEPYEPSSNVRQTSTFQVDDLQVLLDAGEGGASSFGIACNSEPASWPVDLSAFTDITSLTEAAGTQMVGAQHERCTSALAQTEGPSNGMTHQLCRFLSDVSASQDNVENFGKYGKKSARNVRRPS